MKIGIFDYGAGNLASVFKAFNTLGCNVKIVEDTGSLNDISHLVLPGVGNFSSAMRRLAETEADEKIRNFCRSGKAFLGICLGMQLLASKGSESTPLELEWTEGLNLIPGRVEQLKTLGCNLAQPHVGWNDLIQKSSHPAFAGIADGIDFYFVHSFAFTPAESNHVIGVTDYDISITAVVSHDNILGCQFHPEKSSKAGQLFLQNWLKTC